MPDAPEQHSIVDLLIKDFTELVLYHTLNPTTRHCYALPRSINAKALRTLASWNVVSIILDDEHGIAALPVKKP